MEKDGGESMVKVPRLSLKLPALKTETESCKGFGACFSLKVSKSYLSYDVAVIPWITLCHKNRMTTRVITLWRAHVTSLTTSVSTMRISC